MALIGTLFPNKAAKTFSSSHPRKFSEGGSQGLQFSAIHSNWRRSTGAVEGPCIRAGSSCQDCKKAFFIPATSVPSERLYSASGYIDSPLRSHFKPNKVNMLTFFPFFSVDSQVNRDAYIHDAWSAASYSLMERIGIHQFCSVDLFTYLFILFLCHQHLFIAAIIILNA